MPLDIGMDSRMKHHRLVTEFICHGLSFMIFVVLAAWVADGHTLGPEAKGAIIFMGLCWFGLANVLILWLGEVPKRLTEFFHDH